MPDWLVVAAAAVGVVGGLAGVASFLWQVATWRRATHRIKVSRSQAWFTYPDGSFSPDLVAVTVANVGSAPVTVVAWGVEMRPTRESLNVLKPMPGSTPLPHRLEAGASLGVHVEAKDLRRAGA